ncbi:MAG: Xaa-Pro dipeptidase [Pseudomonadales bacterium]|nr:Xaa-Pro dipeptidase [Pseudomonadales bacterium]
MPFALHYAQHISRLCERYAEVLADTGFDAVLLHSGSERVYFADDQHPPFKASGHFLHWLPVNRPEQMVLIMPGETPVYFQVIPPDFWYEQHITLEDWVAAAFERIPLQHSRDALPHLQRLLSTKNTDKAHLAFIGENTAFAETLGVAPSACNPTALVNALDYGRAYKSEYEVASIRKANRLALQGHTAARHAFEDGGSEYDIHMAYLQACGMLDDEMPYPTIVGLDEKAAILHYQNKRRSSGADSQVLLIDAGCRVNAYCSDITRTWTRPGTSELFKNLVEAMEALQTGLVARIRPGMPYPDLHRAAHEGITNILLGAGICRGSREALIEHKMSTLFMPHGVGHLLGIQVHDVGGRMKNASGEIQPPPEDYPTLRTTRMIETDQVFTVEPGLYFIPVLLNPERNTARGKLIDWEVVDAMTPLGGIRIEDNVRVTDTGVENLTRVLI